MMLRLWLLSLLCVIQNAGGSLVITGICGWAQPTFSVLAVELFVTGDIEDLSRFGMSSCKTEASNCPPSPSFQFPKDLAAKAGDFLYLSPGDDSIQRFFNTKEAPMSVPTEDISFDMALYDGDMIIDNFNNRTIPLHNFFFWVYRKSGTGPDKTQFKSLSWYPGGRHETYFYPANKNFDADKFPVGSYQTPSARVGVSTIRTWDGTEYEYRGQCELVLLEAPLYRQGTGLMIHARFSASGRDSYLSSVAIVFGTDLIEFTVDNIIYVNREKVDKIPRFFSGHATSTDAWTHTRTNFVRYRIALVSQQWMEVLIINDFGDHKVMGLEFKNIRYDVDDFHHSIGMIGNFNKGVIVSRDLTISDQDKLGDIASSWQIQGEQRLFDNPDFDPRHPEPCRYPSDDEMENPGPEDNPINMLRFQLENSTYFESTA